MFENRVLRRIFGPKREEVAGDWRRLHNEELHNLYDSLILLDHQVKECEMGSLCSMHGNDEKCVQKFVRKTRRENRTRKT
jgi:hypothetical protein